MYVDEDRRFVFYHIPKTAGQSFIKALGLRVDHKNPHPVPKNVLPRYDDYLRFCFVRNPWSRVVSAYHYSVKMVARGQINSHRVREILAERPCADVNEFVCEVLDEQIVRSSLHFKPQHLWVVGGAANFVGRFESIESDTAWLGKSLGIALDLPHKNKSKVKASYSDVLSSESRDKIALLYKKDVSIFNYKF